MATNGTAGATDATGAMAGTAGAMAGTAGAMAGTAGATDGAVSRDAGPDAEAVAFVRFCYRRRAVAWPELYDEMCAVAARGDYRGMGYEQLGDLGIRFVLEALPGLADMAARVIAEERGRPPSAAAA